MLDLWLVAKYPILSLYIGRERPIMINDHIAENIAGGQEVSLIACDNDEKEIDRLVSALRAFGVNINCNVSFLRTGGCKVTLDIPQVETRKRTLVVSALSQTSLNIKKQEINDN